jgi:hypothetical protein
MTIFKYTLHHHRKNVEECRKESADFFRVTALGGYLEDRSSLWGWGEGGVVNGVSCRMCVSCSVMPFLQGVDKRP